MELIIKVVELLFVAWLIYAGWIAYMESGK